jgi:TonB-linked SusC/RagA family outer membrane protein
MKNLVKLFSLFFIMTGLIGFAQGTVSGTVTDTDGLPLPGATVVVQGTSIGVTSDFDGNYSISASQGDVLVFSYVGYTSQSITVGTSSTVNASLESSTALEEVVVTGIGSQERSKSVASIVTVKSELIENSAFTSPDQALNGRVSGLRIATISGSPGSASQIRIRGEGSISGNNSPLFVIDGIPISNGTVGNQANGGIGILSMINPNDIESITVLKDASSTSVYGNRGSNGVIVITTKKGSAGKVTYNVQAQYGWQNKAVEGIKMLTGVQRLELASEMLMNTYGWSRDQATNWNLTNRTDFREWEAAGRVDGGWQDLVEIKDAPLQNYNISASGGTASENFRVSLGYKQQDGIGLGSEYEQISGSFSFTKKSGRVTINTSNRVTNGEQLGQLEGSAYFGNPMATKYFMSPNHQAKRPDGSWYVPHPAGAHHTPYLMENNIYKAVNTRALSNSSFSYDFTDDLRIKSAFAIDYNLGDSHRYQNPIEGDGVGENGVSDQTSSKRFTWSTINSLEYSNSFGDNDHFVSAILRQSFQRNKNNYIDAYGENAAAQGLYYVSSFTTNQSSSGSFSDWKQLSYAGVLNYSFRDKYVFNFTWRNDGSSRFASGYRFGNFFSYGLAWNINNENFLADSSVVNSLKLRASWGESGDSNIGLNQYQSLFAYDADYDDSGAVYPTSFGNAVISWEKAEKLDIGLDFTLFNNRVNGSVGYYNKKTNDLLQSVPLSLTTGHSSQTQNVGDVENKGIEIELDATVFKIGDFSMDLYGNYSTNKNKVLRLAQDAEGNDINLDGFYTATRVGRPIYEYYLRQWGGVDSANGSPLYIVGGDGVGAPPSQEITTNYNSAKQTFVGSRIPEVTGALGTRLKFKGLTVDANFTYAGGHKIYTQWAGYFLHSGRLSTHFYQGAAALMDRWQKPGDVTDIPKMIYSTNRTLAGSYHNTRFLYDGDFIRLRDLTANYQLPKSVLGNSGLTSASVFVKGTNIWTWTKDDFEFDPEVSLSSGQWNLWNPVPKSWTVGVNLNF